MPCSGRKVPKSSVTPRRKFARPVYEDWNDYFRHAPRVSDDFVEAMSGARRDLLPLENRESLDIN